MLTSQLLLVCNICVLLRSPISKFDTSFLLCVQQRLDTDWQLFLLHTHPVLSGTQMEEEGAPSSQTPL